MKQTEIEEINSIKKMIVELEKFTGIECLNNKQLSVHATFEQIKEAWHRDKNWFKGYADTIYMLT